MWETYLCIVFGIVLPVAVFLSWANMVHKAQKEAQKRSDNDV